jgi:hypothetical protein
MILPNPCNDINRFYAVRDFSRHDPLQNPFAPLFVGFRFSKSLHDKHNGLLGYGSVFPAGDETDFSVKIVGKIPYL